jgi:hypothetical protein
MKRNLTWFAFGVISAMSVFACLPLFVPARQLPDPVATEHIVLAQKVIYELESLRSGETNRIIEHLEAELDSRIEDMGYYLNSPHGIIRQNVESTVLHAKEYRNRFPRKTINPQVYEAVEKVFSKVR